MMKDYIICLFVQIIFTICSGSSIDSKLIFSSPIGPYRLVFKQVYNCNPTPNNKIQLNMYLSHKENITMLVGNSTSSIPLDDNLFLEMKMAHKDSYGIWKENVYMHKSPKGCSTIKQLLGKAWPGIIHGYGFPNVNCPISPGVYISPGMDPSIYENANFPKTFFYGTYKLHVYYSRKNDIIGCQGFIFDVKRP